MKTERIAAGFFEPSPPLALGVVLDHKDPNYREDQTTLAALLRIMPEEM
jgi:hypothetical protein